MTRCDGAAAEAFSHVISSGPQGPLDTTWPAAVPSYVNICVSMHPKSEYASMQGPPHNALAHHDYVIARLPLVGSFMRATARSFYVLLYVLHLMRVSRSCRRV
eukprot:CAMPEP_0181168694 /NCGR_PEP_ID=MMETSP1096-20121128/411_1 /TAXON_ID=156174 ORGANISM="Chrysochromulina ericina, Strain CCMP281" /NCGR_SAMPLE_ID=MMETSP1096 /ASSEMBLY_ACC=CAM_ASM_000453 /LENGTH=102 /DNA_ID=CAMNT_0023256089 /DNA_START=166 /DNA_END=475 /DNA_ORIENTATION=+